MPNQPTDTPRTDAVHWKFHTHDDIVNLARDLERELNEANRVIRMWEHGEFRAMKLFKELNAALAALKQVTRDADATARDRDEWMTRCMQSSAIHHS
jgi:hypothetical protein